MYRPTLMEPDPVPQQVRYGLGFAESDPNCASGMPFDVNGDPCPGAIVPSPVPVTVPSPLPLPSSLMLPSNMQAVTYKDGSKGFLDPADGTYYDSQGNDITGYVQNFGGAKVTGPASAAAIAAAEGIPVSSGVRPPVVVNLPPGPSPRVAVPGAMPPPVVSPVSSLFGGMSNSTLLLLGGGLIAVLALGGRRR